MRRYVFFLLILSSLVFPQIRIHLNGELYASFQAEELLKISYNLPKWNEPGVSFLEILPLMEEIGSLTLENDHERMIIEDDVSNKLWDFYLLWNGKNWDVLRGNTVIFQDLRDIEIVGDEIEGGEIEVWISWEGTEKLKEEIKRFEKLHKGIKVKVVDVPKTEGKLLTVMKAGGKLPDIVMVQGSFVSSLKRAKAIQSLDYIFKDVKSALIEKSWKAFELDGRIWAIPFYLDTQMVFYNRKLFQERKIPFPRKDWTLSEMEEIASSLNGEDTFGLIWNAYSAYWFIPFQLGFGKERIVEEDGRVIIDDEATKEAITYVHDSIKKKTMHAMERDAMVSFFARGKTGMILGGSFMIPEFKRLELDFSVVPYPFNEGKKKYISPLLDFKGFSIVRKTKEPILARRLIEYLISVGVQERFCENFYKLPVNEDAFEALKEKDEIFETAFESVKIGYIIPTSRMYRVYKSTMWKLLRLVFSGKMSVEEVSEKGQKILDRIWKEGTK